MIATFVDRPRRRVAVLGAGLAGLVAARELERRGAEVLVFEGSRRISGLAGSDRDPEGFSYDTGAHFITNRLAAAIGCGADCLTVGRYGESVVVGSRIYRYPLGLLAVPRYAASAVAGRLSARPFRDDAASAFCEAYGEELAREVAIPLVEAWSGARAGELSRAVVDKLPASIGEQVWLKLGAIATRRAVAIGYCSTQPNAIGVFHVYPRGGVGTVCARLADQLRSPVRLESPIRRILVEHGRAVAVETPGGVFEVDAVVSTAPINVLPKLVYGTNVLDPYREFQFRPMVFVNLRLRGEGLLPDVVLWTPGKQHPFFRLTEATQSMPWLAPPGRTILTCDIGASIGDEHWTMDDERLAELCLEHVTRFVRDAKSRYLGCRVVRTPIAYPVFYARYEAARKRLANGTGIDNLLSVGRNGEFDHLLMEDVYWRCLARLRSSACLMDDARSRKAA